MNKINIEELRGLPLEELLERYPLEELEKLIPLKELLEKFPDVEEDPKGGTPGVLLSDEIKRYVKEFRLIWPFNQNNLKAASYRLTIGDEYALGGKKENLDKNNKITIPPFQVAIIKTHEIINMPRFLIGRWNIRVASAYEGLIWVGGPQVDPGWVGHLFCPIYNLSDEYVVLEKGKPVATIDFIRTTTFKKGGKDEIVLFSRFQQRKSITDYNWRLKSALFTEAAQRIDKIESKVNRVESLVGVMFTCIAVLFAALSILVMSRGVSVSESTSLPVWVIGWSIISVTLSIVAIAIALFSRVKLEIKNLFFRNIVGIFYIAYVVISAIVIIAFAIIALGVKII
jgi:dCTP deaminase